MIAALAGMAWLWVPVSLAAALAQTGRNAAQTGLTARIGTMGATGVRFLFGLPFALLFLALVARGQGVPVPGPRALGFAAMGAATQVAATALMLTAMRRREFAVATALMKTEPVSLALMGAAILNEAITPLRALGIGVATAGVMMASGSGWRRAGLGPAVLAVAAGALFGASAIGFRGAILALPWGGNLLRSTTALALTLAMQVAMVGLWLALRDRAALRGMVREWRGSLGAGFLGALASELWFFGFSLTSAANVRTLALVELVFAAAVSRHRREALGAGQIAGMVLIAAGVAALLRAG